MKQAVVFEIGWNACIKCGACVAVCPQEPGFTTPFDTIAVKTPCDIACMFCEAICPVSTITHTMVVDESRDMSIVNEVHKSKVSTHD